MAYVGLGHGLFEHRAQAHAANARAGLGDDGALDDLGDGQAVVFHTADAATQVHGEPSPVAVPLHVEQAREAALLHELALDQEGEPVGLEARGDDRLQGAVLQGVEHEGEDLVAALDAEGVVDCLEVEDVEHNHGVGATVPFGEHTLGLSDEALARVAVGHGVVVLLLEQLVQLVVGARQLGGDDLAVAHGALHEHVPAPPVFEHDLDGVDGLVDAADGVHVRARAEDVVGDRARRAGLVEAHQALMAFLADLELGVQPLYRVVEADDGVVFVDDVSARRNIAHGSRLRSAARCITVTEDYSSHLKPHGIEIRKGQHAVASGVGEKEARRQTPLTRGATW